MKKYFNILYLFLILCATILFSKQGIEAMKNIMNKNQELPIEKIIVIDAGHGGRDPGKVGTNNVLEKDINLAIALELKLLLEQNDIIVIMTRLDDNGLYSETDRNKKAADLKKRVEIIKESNPIMAISIHQNSFEQSQYRGAQVFYYKQSTQGKELAQQIQEQIKASIKDDNHRVAKSNDNYYMLKQVECPLVIVECGFLSNEEEANLLSNVTYQQKMAWAIHLGILKHMNK